MAAFAPAGASTTGVRRSRPAHARATPLAESTASRCPWTSPAERSWTATRLADQVLARMTLAEKLGTVSLYPTPQYENSNVGIPRLCIPALTLQDGPNGIATGDTGVTQLPASLGVAASFAPSLAFQYGQVLGAEARAQGIGVVQGPNLNLDRVPMSGRAFEAYGEDPLLTSAMGVADIEGIQSQGVMSNAKHFTAYTQETARLNLNQLVSERALEELYLPPFKAAVQQAHVASVMCAFGEINYVPTCQDLRLLGELKGWGLTGFVRSDLGAVSNPVLAFRNGLDMIKPAAVAVLEKGVTTHKLSTARLDDAVRRILTMSFTFGLVQHPLRGRTHTRVYTRGHTAVALRAAEASVVLLKDRAGLLPLSPKPRSVAVIGESAYRSPMTAGQGSAYVLPPFVITPLGAIRRALGSHVAVTYAQGVPADRELPAPPPSTIVAGSLAPLGGGGHPVVTTTTQPPDLGVLNQPGVVTASVATAVRPGVGRGWLRWDATLVVPRTGVYAVSVTSSGDTWLSVDGSPLLSSPGLHGPATWSAAIALVAGRRYQLALDWFHVGVERNPRLGLQDVSPRIAAAAEAARRARVAVVFANDFNEEGFDRPDLGLPGAQDELIAAVAAANPRTVVVLNTGGPVLMPWLRKVDAVLEAWYPGEEDGTAIAAVVTGRVDPAGRLPVTFPATQEQAVGSSQTSWPGFESRVVFSNEGIGYRYFQSHRLSPLFPFGFGLDYTGFALSPASLSSNANGYRVALSVANVGHRTGTDVVQAYLGFPKIAAEPPEQLVAFTRVTVEPGTARSVYLFVPKSAFRTFVLGRFVTVQGTYTISVGQSSASLPIRLNVTVP